MIGKTLSALLLAAALGFGAAAPVPALADGCLSQSEVRAAVQSGQAIPLSSVIGQIRATVSGEILSSPMLCDYGGRLVYLVNVLAGGQVTRLQVDAQTGSISY